MHRPGLSGVRASFEYLLSGDDPVAGRYDHVLSNVRMMGAAAISSTLSSQDGASYPVWENRAKAGLVAFGVPEHSLSRSSQVSRALYLTFCNKLGEALAQLAQEHPEFDDLLSLDFLLYFISMRGAPRPLGAIETLATPADDFAHDEVVDQVLDLGEGLGFDVQKGFDVTRGCRIDAIWRSRLANLGAIAYAFEVHRHGSRDSAILNLQRVLRDPTVQRVVIVSSEAEIRRFREEVWSLGEDFRNALSYLSADDLQTSLAHIEAVQQVLKRLGLPSAESFSF